MQPPRRGRRSAAEMNCPKKRNHSFLRVASCAVVFPLALPPPPVLFPAYPLPPLGPPSPPLLSPLGVDDQVPIQDLDRAFMFTSGFQSSVAMAKNMEYAVGALDANRDFLKDLQKEVDGKVLIFVY